MPDAVALNRGTTVGAAIGAGANHDDVVDVAHASALVVQVDMTAGAAADAVVTVTPYEADGLTLSAIPLPASPVIAPVLAVGHAYTLGKYDVTAIDKVRVRLNNANVGAQTITRKSWRTESP